MHVSALNRHPEEVARLVDGFLSVLIKSLELGAEPKDGEEGDAAPEGGHHGGGVSQVRQQAAGVGEEGVPHVPFEGVRAKDAATRPEVVKGGATYV